MKRKHKKPDLFLATVYVVLFVLTIACLVPVLNVLAISFSSKMAVAQGRVSIFPVEFDTTAYEHVMKDIEFFKSIWVSVKRVLVGVALNLGLTILCAYPLSRTEKQFRARKFYMWLFYFTCLFGGGLVPTYMVINKTGLMDTFWALVIPGAVPVGYVIMMMNFFRNLPRELEEAALVDGANQWQILTKVYLPLSKASIATISLFCIVNHWNEWFSGVIYFFTSEGQPMATYLHKVMDTASLDLVGMAGDLGALEEIAKLSSRTINAAKMFMAMIPVLVVYPFLRKHFAQGIVMGSVKG